MTRTLWFIAGEIATGLILIIEADLLHMALIVTVSVGVCALIEYLLVTRLSRGALAVTVTDSRGKMSRHPLPSYPRRPWED